MTGNTTTDYSLDPIPRIIASDEYDELERGLKQRVNALNAFLRDIYSDKNIIHDGVIPEEFVYLSRVYSLGKWSNAAWWSFCSYCRRRFSSR